MVTWLQSTLAACNRLATVTVVRMELPDSDEDSEPGDEVVPVDPAVMGSLLASIGRACPNLRCLHIDGIDCAVEELVRVMFAAIGQHLPRIVDLQLGLAWGSNFQKSNIQNFDVAGIDWAACLPLGLQTFHSSGDLHHELLQHLVQMPALVCRAWAMKTQRCSRLVARGGILKLAATTSPHTRHLAGSQRPCLC